MAILCGYLDYTSYDHSSVMGRGVLVNACVYKIMMVGLVSAYLYDKGTFFLLY